VGGYAFVLAGGAISWSSALQPVVLFSSSEAEYIALTDMLQYGAHALLEVGVLQLCTVLTIFSAYFYAFY
jgi:esterase/lipase superfamily enzyme